MSTIGSLNIKLGLDSTAFETALDGADSAIGKFVQEVTAQFRALEQQMTRIGAGLTAAITVPFALTSRTATKTAGDFETAMNRVQAALRPLTGNQIDQLRAAAMKLGPAVGMSATEAAEAIETLALSGMSASAILSGGLQQTLIIAKANLGGVEDAAALTTDVMRQFNLVNSQIPEIATQATGALDKTKFAFVDYQQAVSQAGGVAGALGVSFADFNAALAASAPLFASGADAGTSFKTFLTSLRGSSEEAKRTIAQLGLTFFTASGQMRPMGEIAEELRTKLGGLSDQTRTVALTNIFGTDGMRTAIGLMQQGREGLSRLRDEIGRTDVGEKLRIQMQGLNQALTDLANAGERLKIALGDAGLLAVFTALAGATGGLVGAVADLPTPFLSVSLAVGALAAAIGPLILLFTKVIVPVVLMTGRLGLLGTALAALVNPIGLLVIVLTKLAVSLGLVGAAATALASRIAAILGPITLLAIGIGVLTSHLWSQKSAMDAARDATVLANQRLSEAQGLVMQLAGAHGELRAKILATIAAQLALAHMNRAFAQGRLNAAEANVARRERAERAPVEWPFGEGLRRARRQRADEARAVRDEVRAEIRSSEQTIASLTTGLMRAREEPGGGVNVPNLGAAPERTRKPRGDGRDRAREIAERNHRREMLALQEQLEVARAREDHDQVRAIERQMTLKEGVREYRDLEYSAAEARARLVAHQHEMDQAEAETRTRRLAEMEREGQLEQARLELDFRMVHELEAQAEKEELINRLRREGLTLAEAEAEATEQMALLENSRLRAIERINAEKEKGRQRELARLRGDRAEERRLDRELWVAERAREIRESSRGAIDDVEAGARAAAEWAEGEEARLTGIFRDTFRDGVMAALTGDFGNWFERWWTEQLTDSLTDALNSVADLLRDLLKRSLADGGSGGVGGFLGDLLGDLGSIFGISGRRGGINIGDGDLLGGGGGAGFAGMAALLGKLPGFATGGSFDVGGRGGIDQNLVSFWATRGEHVNISKGESRPQKGGTTIINMNGVMTSDEFWGHIEGRAQAAEVRGGTRTLSTIARKQGRAIPSRSR